MKLSLILIFWGGEFDYKALNLKLKELKNLINTPDIWEKPEAKQYFKSIKELEKKIEDFDRIKKSLQNLEEFYELFINDEQEDYFLDLLKESQILLKDSTNVRYLNLMNDQVDQNNAFLEIHAGAGGTESQDWAEMLQRMYIRWCESKGGKVSILQETRGEEAGIKSCVLKITNEYSYGWLKKESGIHRLVRISPFDSNKRRHTSFASVWVYPEIDDNIEVDLQESDCRIDTYRSSGAGGQHVNTTDSAVRITHAPTNIVVQCQSQRSQHKNKSTALSMLRARLYELELQKKEEKAQEILDTKSEIGWGHQIRSYVLQPYQMVKDLRTNVEDGNTQAVLDGRIDKFLTSALSRKIS